MAELIVRPGASADIADIFACSVDQFGADVARDYLAGLQAAIARLADFPEYGTVFPGTRPPIRYLAYRRHHVFYDYDGATVWVARILHNAMDVRGRV